MPEHQTPHHRRQPGSLVPLTSREQDEVMRRWQEVESGMEGERGLLPKQPDNPVAHALLDAAGIAFSRSEWRHGVAILHLAVRQYPRSEEAACARTVIDRLAGQGASHGR